MELKKLPGEQQRVGNYKGDFKKRENDSVQKESSQFQEHIKKIG